MLKLYDGVTKKEAAWLDFQNIMVFPIAISLTSYIEKLMSTPKICVLDIETSPLESYTWALWDQNVSLKQIKTEWSVISAAWKWLDEKKVHYHDTSGRGPSKIRHDLQVLQRIWETLDAADIVIAQNGNSFDVKKINARLLMHGFAPYSPIRIVDTLTVSKRHFAFTSNKLEWLADHLTDTKKDDHKEFPGFELWVQCMADNPKAWRWMKRYNINDVIATEKLYKKLRPWIANHPNLPAYTQSEIISCPKCDSGNLIKSKNRITQQGSYIQYQCKDCGGYARGKTMQLATKKRKNLLVSL